MERYEIKLYCAYRTDQSVVGRLTHEGHGSPQRRGGHGSPQRRGGGVLAREHKRGRRRGLGSEGAPGVAAPHAARRRHLELQAPQPS